MLFKNISSQSVLLRIPQIFGQIDITVGIHIHTVIAQKVGLHLRSAKGECRRTSSKAVHHTKARYMFGIGVEMQCIPHGARGFGRTAKTGDLPIGCNLSLRYLFDLFIHQIVKTHMPIFSRLQIFMPYALHSFLKITTLNCSVFR